MSEEARNPYEQYPLRYVARVTLEFATPFHIGAGREGEVEDAAILTDANGLPAIPGSSLAGVLRSLFAKKKGVDRDEQTVNRLFGWQGSGDNGQGSRLSISWACVHNSKNEPVEGILSQTELFDDKVLAAALSSGIRDHVRINHRGAADDRGKFDEALAMAGHRFTFEMELAGTEEDGEDWKLLLSLLSSPSFRLGGKTRRGLGAVKEATVKQRCFDLKDDLKAYADHPVSLCIAVDKPFESVTADKTAEAALKVDLDLKPSGLWMFGGGDDIAAGDDEKPADMAPVRDDRVVWVKGETGQETGKVEENLFVVPGSSVKGAIAHRVAFHYNCLMQHFANAQEIEKAVEEAIDKAEAQAREEDQSEEEQQRAGRAAGDAVAEDCLKQFVGENNPAVCELFGYAKGENDGRRGVVLIDDVFLPDHEQLDDVFLPGHKQLKVHHNSLSRFTGGTRQGVLFAERPLYGGGFKLSLKVADGEGDSVSMKARKALLRTLEDLVDGRLQLGAGSGRGLGFMHLAEGREQALSEVKAWAGEASNAK